MLKQAMRSIGLILKYARIPTLVSLMLRLMQSFEAPLSIYFTGALINNTGAYIAHEAALSDVIKWAVLLLVMMLFSANSNLFYGLIEIYTRRALNRNLTSVVLEKFRRLEYACFENPDVLNTLERMGSDPQMRIYRLYSSAVDGISSLISMVGTAVVFTQISVWFAIVYFVLLAPMLWFNYKDIEARQKLWNTEMPNWRRRTYLSALMADKHAAFELKVFNAMPFILKKWKRFADDFRREFVRMRLKSSKFGVFQVLTLAAWAAFVILSVVSGLSRGTVTIGAFVACLTSMGTMLGRSSSMSQSFSQVSQESLEMKHYDIFMSLPEIPPEDSDKTGTAPPDSPHIVFDNVYFSYPGTDKPILRGVSFEIKPYERVALVGENGAGKSTIVKLLCGLYKPDSGDIYINGISISLLPRTYLRKVFSVVFQDYCGFELTLRENVAFGNIVKLHDDTALKTALENGLWTENMPLEQNLGKLEDDGIDLSGGQWQKIAVARALAGGGAFVILDEPTASLDPVAESRMYETFQSVLSKRGCVMISHRLASARLADKIVVIDNGTAAQSGTHDMLMSEEGLYREMFNAQSAWYLGGAEGA